MSSVESSGRSSMSNSESGDGVARNKSSFFTREAAKDLKYRNEWEEDREQCTPQEIRAWYYYDFAHSGFPSAGNVLWVPIILFYLARNKACPYSSLPEDPYKPQLGWSPYDGYQNASMAVCKTKYTQKQTGWEDALEALDEETFSRVSNVTVYEDCTTCKLNSSAISNYGRWMERGNSEYGMPTYTATQRKLEPTEDENEIDAKARMLLDDDSLAYYDVDYRKIICQEYTGEVSVSPIYNVSLSAAKNQVDSDVDSQEQGYDRRAGIARTLKGTYGLVDIPFNTTTTGDPLTTADIDLVVSTNPNFFNSSSTWSVVERTPSDAANPKEQEWTLTLVPEEFAVGSTTLKFSVGDADVRFTFTSLEFEICPYRVGLFGIQLKPVSYASMAISISVLFQAISLFFTSAFGDFGPYRKTVLLQSAAVGVIGHVGFLFIGKPDDYAWGAYLLIMITVSLAVTICMYNAYIPELARNSPEFTKMMADYKEKKGEFNPNKSTTKEEKKGKKKRAAGATETLVRRFGLIQDNISENGMIWGYTGASINVVLSTMVVTIVSIMNPKDKTLLAPRMAVVSMGIWWAVFTVPFIRHVRKRSGPPLPGRAGIPSYCLFSMKRQISTAFTMKHLPNTRNFLFAFFLYTDGISTISQCAILFAFNELGMSILGFVGLALLSPACGALNQFIVQKLQKKYEWETKDILVTAISVYTAICAYGLLGYSNIIGVIYVWELWLFVPVYGGFLAIYESASRTSFCELVPPGQLSEFFGFYEISDKGSSWVGPAIVALLYERYNSVRGGFIYLMFVCGLAVYILLYHVDYIQGANDARDKSKSVRMEAIRAQFGVSKKQIQAEIKKRKQLRSSVMSSTNSSAASGVSSMSSKSGKSMVSMVSKNENSNSSAERSSVEKEDQ
mmetsp:Transcript_19625/g.41013  ORF Transcript_19625/g.41013 Transcript_19625/m.41013 type:complete len:901 (-) Transcript_19625:20-2722(-)